MSNPRPRRSVSRYVGKLSAVVLLLLLLGAVGFAERLTAQSPTFAFAEDSTYADDAYLRQVAAFAKTLPEYETKLQAAATLMLRSRQPEHRAAGYDTLAAGLPRALAVPGAREYAFAKLEGVSQLTDPAGAWRIFTWQHFVNDSTYRYGGLYVPTDAGKPVVALVDAAQAEGAEDDFELTPEQWYGAVYYGVRLFRLADGRPAWVLFGYDADGYYHRRKVADVLSFDRAGTPRFGAEVFVGSERQPELVRSRIILEYRTDARVSIRYDAELGGIVHERLVVGPPPVPGAAPGNVPDGSYDGFTLDEKAGLWRYRQEYFDRVISAEPPRPQPILGASGEQRDLFGRPKRPKTSRPQGSPRTPER